MQIESVNRRATENYSAFVTTIGLVPDALEGLKKLVDKVDDDLAGPGFTVATQDELQGFYRTAVEELDRLRAAAKTWEIELVSREWRY